MKKYMVTLSTGAPQWLTSKWVVEAEEKSQALNYALLLHDNPDRPQNSRWPVAMVTISYYGANPEICEADFAVADPEQIARLLRIYQHGKERLENC